MTAQERKAAISNIIGSMKGISGPEKDEIIKRQLIHFEKMDPDFAKKVAEGV